VASAYEPQVVVVGAGPAGLVASIALARYGIRVLLIDKHDPSPLARALAISVRSMEIFRAWGVEEEVRAGGVEVEPMAWVGPTLSSPQGVVMPLGAPSAAESALVSPTRPAWGPQTHLEKVLGQQARSCASLTVTRGVELVEVHQGGDQVELLLRDRATGAAQAVLADYVIGADGARSTVRAQLRLSLEGPDDLGEYHRIDFRADLSAVVGDRRFGLYVITHPEASGVLALRGPDHLWSFNREWRNGEPRMVDQPDAWVLALLRAALGGPDFDLSLERRSAFAFAAQVADHFRSGRGFLAGDAAHRMTPRGGTGMNTAIQDGFDLGWKLSWVLLGWAGETLLDTYEPERRTIGTHNVTRAGRSDGARRGSEEAMAWDLAGRLPHRWIDVRKTISTLDLVGPGLTRLLGPRATSVESPPAGISAPMVQHRLDEGVAGALGLGRDSTVLLRPDAKVWNPPEVDEEHPPTWPMAGPRR
jgi:2-polyprenyl-6-methoxyphenol hydroxylase-like FAD-dependent oxidoreductase